MTGSLTLPQGSTGKEVYLRQLSGERFSSQLPVDLMEKSFFQVLSVTCRSLFRGWN